MQNNKVKNIFFIEEDMKNYKTGLYIEMEDGRKFANCTTDPIKPFNPIEYIPGEKSPPSSEISDDVLNDIRDEYTTNSKGGNSGKNLLEIFRKIFREKLNQKTS